ncbi:hypothetical protein OED52_20555 [Rhodococcus sp. Z13]|uniref:Uncharacterized protein n=1 Tax=Rhodococcus sacchari TaxID=2962047 RepID=A0ACD4DG81_9NOCA|nr:DUF6777 domain-containing protein [Rhodococcus sp. Z13]UYP18991.1 hypothetical protein OED52_20555 [Rhodococcus sp. Z13]
MASDTIRGFGLALALTALVASACSSDDAVDTPTVVRLQVATAQNDPWTPRLVPAQVPVAVPPPPPEVVEGPGDPVHSGSPAVTGDREALYGGSLDRPLCDRSALVTHLEEDPAKAEAWRDVLKVADIRGYTDTLAPVLLRGDTRVTMYEYSDGEARPVQSLLERGTIVLVDDLGVPRVRCVRGNPLTAPVFTARDEFDGPKWPGLDTGRQLVVQPAAAAVRELRVVDITTGAMVPVPVGEALAETAPTTPPPAPQTQAPAVPAPQQQRSIPAPEAAAAPPPPPAPEPPPPPPAPEPVVPEPVPAAPVPPPAAPAPAPAPAPPPPQIQIQIPGGPPVVIPLPF